MIDTLKPLPTAELRRRYTSLQPSVASGTRQDLLDALAATYEQRPRAERRMRGTPLPEQLAAELTAELRALKWPEKSHRPGLHSERYLVLHNRKGLQACGTRHPHFRLRRLCDAVLAFAGGTFEHTAIAVTKNFVGSPHVDVFDRSKQLAVSLGDVSGGELCVDEDPSGIDVDAAGGEEAPRHCVAVVETLNCVASLDGRHVHWVRRFDGGDRFSVIFYNTEAEQETGQLNEPASPAALGGTSEPYPWVPPRWLSSLGAALVVAVLVSRARKVY